MFNSAWRRASAKLVSVDASIVCWWKRMACAICPRFCAVLARTMYA
jgi:hypothetical protein